MRIVNEGADFSNTGWEQTKQALSLYVMRWQAVLHRFRYDFAKEFVVLACVSIICATYTYIFADFLQRVVASVSTNMRAVFADYAYMAVAVCVGLALGRFCRKEGETPYFFLQSKLGVGSLSRRLSLLMSIVTAVLMSLFVFYFLADYFLRPPSHFVASILYLLAFSIACLWKSLKQPASMLSTFFLLRQRGEAHSMYQWRWLQIWRAQYLLFLLALLVAAGSLLLCRLNAPLPVFSCFAMLTGLFLSFALANQVANDMRFAQIERNLSVSHARYMLLCDKLALTLGAIAAGFFVCFYLVGQLLYLEFSLLNTLKTTVLSFLAPMLMPLLVMQIEPRRAIIQYLTATVTTLFIGTAIIATWYALLLYPLLRYFARQITEGRFYRA